MKIITTLISILGFQCIALCQTVTASQPDLTPTNYSVVYSENSQSLVNKESLPLKSREITIASIPPTTQSLTPVNIDFGMTGSFKFIKDASLVLHEDRDVYIEDMLTGKVFDLKKSDSYTFNVTRRFPNRFILHIDKMLMRYAVSSN